jgi:transcriptional regulator with XRE-family HTH domain
MVKTMDETFAIFESIKKIRKSKGITLQEMSSRTGISVNHLSLIELGKTNPSIGTLKKITNALGVPFMSLGNETIASSSPHNNEKKAEVVRKDMRKMLVYPKSKTKVYLLTPDLQRQLEVILSESEPDEQGPEEWYSHEGEEFGFVLEGELEVTVDNEVYVLKEGDSISYRSHLPHRMRRIGDAPCRSIWVVTPPSF